MHWPFKRSRANALALKVPKQERMATKRIRQERTRQQRGAAMYNLVAGELMEQELDSMYVMSLVLVLYLCYELGSGA